jgi:hypothetical protein
MHCNRGDASLVPDEILGVILANALGEGIHEVMMYAATVTIDTKAASQSDPPSESDLQVLEDIRISYRKYMEFRSVLNPAHVCQRFRMEIQRQLDILCPLEFTEKGNPFICASREKVFLNPQDHPHPLLRRLSTLRGFAETCLGVGSCGNSQNLDILMRCLPLLWLREPVTTTALAKVYILLAKQQTIFSEHPALLRDNLPAHPEEYALDLEDDELKISSWERSFLYLGIVDLCFLDFQLRLGKQKLVSLRPILIVFNSSLWDDGLWVHS